MSKKFKRLSAVILAVVMMLGSTVMASAAQCMFTSENGSREQVATLI